MGWDEVKQIAYMIATIAAIAVGAGIAVGLLLGSMTAVLKLFGAA